MKILLSIKPEFVAEIFNGTKEFEYRRSIFKNKMVNKVIVYSTKPVGLIVGEFIIEKVLKDKPAILWEKTSEKSGITKAFFDDYFSGKEIGFALKITSAKLYTKPINPTDLIESFVAPQSFRYLDEDSNENLKLAF